MTFKELGLMPQILSALKEQGYESPTPIQRGAIPPALKGQDVLGCAQTGTGKTCAFAAPILQRLTNTYKKGEHKIRALILTPTRELALQIEECFEPIINTGLFILGALFMSDTLSANFVAEGSTVIYFLVIGCAGWNFVGEFLANMVAAPAMQTIYDVVKNKRTKA